MPESSFKANHGAAVADVVAAGNEQELQSKWLKDNRVDTERRIRLKKLSHMRYQHPDLDELNTFMMDFGMQVVKRTEEEIWYRGYGPDPYVYYACKGPKKFLGGVFEAEDQEAFEKASKLPQAGPVQELIQAPAGGKMVTITDPEGFLLHVIIGQEPVSRNEKQLEKMVPNFPNEKPRVRKFNRFEYGPAAVHKLGHFGLVTQKFEEQLHFYTSTFNIVPSDLLYIDINGHRVYITTFMHLDRGEAYTDHHSFFLSASTTSSHVHHCSFEVHDYDTQHLGHQWLAKQGYRSVWGVGRHVLGSQIFDYWWDINGNMVEHYADGDQVNRDTPIGVFQAGSETLAVWGPEVPTAFVGS